ncbi:MAG: hypothetical protein R3D60_06695 [Paracoccaceae bacterium]
MRAWIRTFEEHADNRLAVVLDSLGVAAIFVLLYAALHLPLLA